MIMFTENLKSTTYMSLLYAFGKVNGYMSNVQKSVAFLTPAITQLNYFLDDAAYLNMKKHQISKIGIY